ncbi:MAG: hypothetical protein IH900_00650 [Proteobacteria bacterium]|nr:hypothetical protein [Pseudomonadota bacterium]
MGATGMSGNFEGFDSTFGHWWVDDEGAWNFWGLDRPNDPEDRERAEQSFRRFALHRLGMVQVTLRPGKAVVEFDLHRADDTALDATVDFFATTAYSGGAELRFFHQAWNLERHPSAAALARRINEVRIFRDVVLANTVTTLKRPLSAPAMVSPRVRDALRLAEARASKLTLLECAGLIPHLMIYRREDRLGVAHWVSLYAGSQSGCAWVYGPDWVREARGRPYQFDEPGRRFSFNVMQAYAGVLDTGEPRLDHIRAVMRRPGKDPLWVPYERLLFRAAGEDGEALLCCLSAITQDIAIPFMRACA